MAKTRESLAQAERMGGIANVLQGRTAEAGAQLTASIEAGKLGLAADQAAASVGLAAASQSADLSLQTEALSQEAQRYLGDDKFRKQQLAEDARRFGTSLDQEARLSAQRLEQQQTQFSFDQERQYDAFEIGTAMSTAMASARDNTERESIKASFIQNSQRQLQEFQLNLSQQEISRTMAVQQIEGTALTNALNMGKFLADQGVAREGLSQNAKRIATDTYTAITAIQDTLERLKLDQDAFTWQKEQETPSKTQEGFSFMEGLVAMATSIMGLPSLND